MGRPVLSAYVNDFDLGWLSSDERYRQIAISLTDSGEATCSEYDLTDHLRIWNTWPEI